MSFFVVLAAATAAAVVPLLIVDVLEVQVPDAQLGKKVQCCVVVVELVAASLLKLSSPQGAEGAPAHAGEAQRGDRRQDVHQHDEGAPGAGQAVRDEELAAPDDARRRTRGLHAGGQGGPCSGDVRQTLRRPRPDQALRGEAVQDPRQQKGDGELLLLLLWCFLLTLMMLQVTTEQYPVMAKYIMDSIKTQLGEKGTDEVRLLLLLLLSWYSRCAFVL